MSVRGGQGPRDPIASPDPTSSKRVNPYQRTGRYGRGPGDQRRYERYGDQRSGVGAVLRFLLFLFILAAVVLVVMATVARPLVRAVLVPWAWSNPSALELAFVSDLVREDLGTALSDPASADATEVEFVVEPGDTPATLAPKLEEAGIIKNQRAFLYEARQDELLPKLNAGRFSLALNLTPAGVVDGLVNNRIENHTVVVTFREGLRAEQMAAKLETVTGTNVDAKAFYNLVMKPTDALLGDYPWLLDENIRPKGASLEGFLYPATYTLRVGDEDPTDAEDLVRMMLDAFHDRVGAERLEVPDKRGLTFYQVLTLASIVEREAVLDDERAKIAGVYQNRIDRVPSVAHGLLQADPTVIYAVDTVNLGKFSPDWAKYVFWTVPKDGIKGQVLPESLAGFDTYQVRGLPPAPIATPTIASIDAALRPDTKSKYTYFVAIPDGNGAHDFSKSLAEHEQKLREYGY
ncbi:MAG TPA: endolytic transglycosylase MltG [Candidatus Limnocylindrales bacterium]